MATLIKRIRDARDDDKGFSLVELAVVALVILALLAIALPTFLGSQKSANDRQAQSNLRNTLTSADIVRAENGGPTYVPASGTMRDALEAQEVAFEFVLNTADSTPGSVSVLATTTGFRAAAMSKSGDCFTIAKITAGGGEGVFYGKVEGGDCSADDVSIAGETTPNTTDTTTDGWK